MARQQTLYEQIETGLGTTVAKARAMSGRRHLFWRGGLPADLVYRGQNYSLIYLLKGQVPDAGPGDPTPPLKPSKPRYFQECSARNCCNPNHFGLRKLVPTSFRTETLHEQMAAGLGMPVARAQALQEHHDHLFWNEGALPYLKFQGRRYPLPYLLKYKIPETGAKDPPPKTAHLRLWRLCDELNCCNPSHYGSAKRATETRVIRGSSSDTTELMTEIRKWLPASAILPPSITTLESLMEAVNPFYERETYLEALRSGLFPQLRRFIGGERQLERTNSDP